MTRIFFKLENCDSEVSQTKNFRVPHPLILPIEKKNLQEWNLNPRSLMQLVKAMRSTNWATKTDGQEEEILKEWIKRKTHAHN